MLKILATLIVLCAMACACGKQHAEERCRKECPEYGATFVRVSCAGESCESKESAWGCWCRRGVESGSGSEPLRIW